MEYVDIEDYSSQDTAIVTHISGELYILFVIFDFIMKYVHVKYDRISIIIMRFIQIYCSFIVKYFMDYRLQT